MLETLLAKNTRIQQNLPGPNTLISGNSTTGFFGELTTNDFIDGITLANAISLTSGTVHKSFEGWLKYSYNSKILYVSKNLFRLGSSFTSIYAVGAAYGTDDTGVYPSGTPVIQNKRVTIQGFNFRVRLIRGSNTDPHGSNIYNVDAPTGVENSEWNRLIVNSINGTLASYTMANLGMDSNSNLNISATYSTTCMERHPHGPGRVWRGARTINTLGSLVGDVGSGWRPVLELA